MRCFNRRAGQTQHLEEEVRWLQQMLAKEQQSKQAVLGQLQDERAKCALLELEILHAAQAAQEMGESLCLFFNPCYQQSERLVLQLSSAQAHASTDKAPHDPDTTDCHTQQQQWQTFEELQQRQQQEQPGLCHADDLHVLLHACSPQHQAKDACEPLRSPLMQQQQLQQPVCLQQQEELPSRPDTAGQDQTPSKRKEQAALLTASSTEQWLLTHSDASRLGSPRPSPKFGSPGRRGSPRRLARSSPARSLGLSSSSLMMLKPAAAMAAAAAVAGERSSLQLQASRQSMLPDSTDQTAASSAPAATPGKAGVRQEEAAGGLRSACVQQAQQMQLSCHAETESAAAAAAASVSSRRSASTGPSGLGSVAAAAAAATQQPMSAATATEAVRTKHKHDSTDMPGASVGEAGAGPQCNSSSCSSGSLQQEQHSHRFPASVVPQATSTATTAAAGAAQGTWLQQQERLLEARAMPDAAADQAGPAAPELAAAAGGDRWQHLQQMLQELQQQGGNSSAGAADAAKGSGSSQQQQQQQEENDQQGMSAAARHSSSSGGGNAEPGSAAASAQPPSASSSGGSTSSARSGVMPPSLDASSVGGSAQLQQQTQQHAVLGPGKEPAAEPSIDPPAANGSAPDIQLEPGQQQQDGSGVAPTRGARGSDAGDTQAGGSAAGAAVAAAAAAASNAAATLEQAPSAAAGPARLEAASTGRPGSSGPAVAVAARGIPPAANTAAGGEPATKHDRQPGPQVLAAPKQAVHGCAGLVPPGASASRRSSGAATANPPAAVPAFFPEQQTNNSWQQQQPKGRSSIQGAAGAAQQAVGPLHAAAFGPGASLQGPPRACIGSSYSISGRLHSTQTFKVAVPLHTSAAVVGVNRPAAAVQPPAACSWDSRTQRQAGPQLQQQHQQQQWGSGRQQSYAGNSRGWGSDRQPLLPKPSSLRKPAMHSAAARTTSAVVGPAAPRKAAPAAAADLRALAVGGAFGTVPAAGAPASCLSPLHWHQSNLGSSRDKFYRAVMLAACSDPGSVMRQQQAFEQREGSSKAAPGPAVSKRRPQAGGGYAGLPRGTARRQRKGWMALF